MLQLGEWYVGESETRRKNLLGESLTFSLSSFSTLYRVVS
jgi:hypothetical protein